MRAFPALSSPTAAVPGWLAQREALQDREAVRSHPQLPTPGLTIVERHLPDAVANGAASLAARPFADLWALIPDGELDTALSTTSVHPALLPLADDIAMLARSYVANNGVRQVELRLERIDGHGCPAFHRDKVRMRLLTTYTGAGTQYVDDADAETALHLQRRFGGPVRSMPTGALGWMCGSEGGAGRDVVHRSPRAGATPRLLLVLSDPLPSSPEPWTRQAKPVFEAAFTGDRHGV